MALPGPCHPRLGTELCVYCQEQGEGWEAVMCTYLMKEVNGELGASL